MGSMIMEKPHAVCAPYPSQGHIGPMTKLAKLLHSKGFYITFVNTQFNHNRLLRSRGSQSLDGLDDFRFATIPDGLPPSDFDGIQDVPALCDSTSKHCLAPFRDLVIKLREDPQVPRISCIVADGVMTFGLCAAEQLGIPGIMFWTASACGLMGYLQYQDLVDRGLVPFKDSNYPTNGILDTPLDWIPGMKGMRLKDIPSFIRTTDPSDIMLNFFIQEVARAPKASAIVLNTFDDMEREVLDALKARLPNIYTIGPLPLMCSRLPLTSLQSIGSNLWKEDNCIDWLDTKEPGSVIYVNYGTTTITTGNSLVEFAWGLANSKQNFLWVIRPDLVREDKAKLPQEFLDATKERGMVASWCPQEQVLAHPSTGGFLTHCGWNSMVESVCGGVPVICWPFFAEQQTNCRYACTHWGIGVELGSQVRREEVEGAVREMMEGERGTVVKKKARELKECAENATKPGGTSYTNLEKVLNEVLRLRE
ncbi:hypothetical protein ACLOJK_013399 [Asimina triloba]